MAIVQGLGTLLKRSGTTVAQRVTISGPALAVPAIKKSTLDSTKAEKRPGLPDAGSLKFSAFYDPANATHQQLITDWKYPTPAGVTWTLQFFNGPLDGNNQPTAQSTWAASGFLTGLEPNGMEEEGNLGIDVTIELTGDVTVTP